MPYGTDAFRKAVVEKYWNLDSSTGYGPANIIATAGGRDALVKAYQAMLALGTGREGDVVIVSRVTWISYWGPYGMARMFCGLQATLQQAGRTPKTAWECGVLLPTAVIRCWSIITNPDNPTGLTISVERRPLWLAMPFLRKALHSFV
jgi:aspartate/methionine/tyrosine aminotransferase